MSCPCCGSEETVFKISYDIYPLIPPKKIPFPVSLFKKPLPNFGIKKESLACSECLESKALVDKLESQNPNMVVCHIEHMKESTKPIEKLKVSDLPRINQQKGKKPDLSQLLSEDFLEKFF